MPPLNPLTTLDITLSGDMRTTIELRAVPQGGPGVKFTPPVATLSGPTLSGAGSVPGYAGCGLEFTLPNGDNAADQCGPSWMPIPEDRALYVKAGAQLTLSLPAGWTITSLDGQVTNHAGIEPAGRGPVATPLVTLSGGATGTATFAAPQAGDWGVMLSVSGRNTDGTQFGVPYYFRVIAAP